MQIYVNDQQLDASLSDEKYVSQIYEEISRWSEENKKYILDVKVDQKEMSPVQLERLDVDHVERLDFYIGDELEMVLVTVDELDRYIDQVGSTLYEAEEISEKEAKDLEDGMHWIRQIMASLTTILNLDLASMEPSFIPVDPENEDHISVELVLVQMEKAIDGFISGERGRNRIEDYLTELRSFKMFIMRMHLHLRAMNAGLEELVELVRDFENQIPDLCKEAVSINESFNTGNDAKALEQMDSFTERLNVFVSALFALDYRRSSDGAGALFDYEVKGVPFRTISAALTELLNDLSDALEQNDIVAAGDILEYEMTDRLNDLLPYLSGIRELVVAQKTMA